MICPNCQRSIDDEQTKCSYCETEVENLDARPMSDQEVSAYQGVTIDQEGNSYEGTSRGSETKQSYQQNKANSGVYVKTYNFPGGLFSTIVAMLVIAGVVFFLLPTFLIIAFLLVAVWFVVRMFI